MYAEAQLVYTIGSGGFLLCRLSFCSYQNDARSNKHQTRD